MILGKVLSRVVSTAKLDSIPKRPLLNVEPLDGFGDRTPVIVIDSVGAGPGDTVLVLQEGTGVRQATLDDPTKPLPAQMAAVGIVDSVDRG